jgi:hypothetical protein
MPRKRKLKPFKYVLHHDDPPCAARLRNRRCPVCNITPDMQSTQLWPYCPNCDIPLTALSCTACKQTFRKP